MVEYVRGEKGQAASRDIETFAPLIAKYAHKFHKRAAGLRSSMEIEDIKQELAIVFLRCTTAYDETKGGSFMNFVISAFYYEMNKLFRRDQRNIEVGATLSESSFVSEDEQESFGILDTVNSGCPTPEESVEAWQAMNEALDSLSEPARVLVGQLLNPHDVLIEQFEMQARNLIVLRKAGELTHRTQKEFDLNFLGTVLQIPDKAFKRLKREIHAKVGVAFDLKE